MRREYEVRSTLYLEIIRHLGRVVKYPVNAIPFPYCSLFAAATARGDGHRGGRGEARSGLPEQAPQ